jgi:serine/threonine-protein kinase RsbW
MSVSSKPDVRIELRSNPLLLAGVRELVHQTARRFGFEDDVAGHMALAVDEALCNVIRHGYQQAPDRPIWLSLFAEGVGPTGRACGGRPCPDQLRIVIEDEAPHVDLAKIKSRDLDEIRPGGLGVHIIKSVMDAATYSQRSPIGMRLEMIKKCVRSSCGETTSPPPSPPSAEVNRDR